MRTPHHRWVKRAAAWTALAALALPVRATAGPPNGGTGALSASERAGGEVGVLDRIEREVAAIAREASQSVVLVRAGARRKSEAPVLAPTGPEWFPFGIRAVPEIPATPPATLTPENSGGFAPLLDPETSPIPDGPDIFALPSDMPDVYGSKEFFYFPESGIIPLPVPEQPELPEVVEPEVPTVVQPEAPFVPEPDAPAVASEEEVFSLVHPAAPVSVGVTLAPVPAIASSVGIGSTSRKRGAAVAITANGPNGIQWSFRTDRVGTGFIVDANGTIVTTTDVVGDAERVEVEATGGRKWSGKVLGSDPVTGVAVVKVEANDLKPLRLASEEERPAPGQWAIIVGNQVGGGESSDEKARSTVLLGTIGRTDVTLAAPSPQGKLLQIQTTAGAGASGAPVLNSRGEVIGIVVAASSGIWRLGGANLDQFVAPFVDAGALAELTKSFGPESAELQDAIRKIVERATEFATKATERARALAEKAGEKEGLSEEEEEKLEADLDRLEDELDRKIEADLKPLEQDLEQKIEAALKPLEERLERDLKPLEERLERDLEPLEEQLARDLKPLEDQLQRDLKPLEEQLERDLKPLEEQLERDLKPLQERLERDLKPLEEKLKRESGPRSEELQREIREIVEKAVRSAMQAVERARAMADDRAAAARARAEAMRAQAEAARAQAEADAAARAQAATAREQVQAEAARAQAEAARAAADAARRAREQQKLDADLQRQIKAITERARRLAQRAAERARAMQERQQREELRGERKGKLNAAERKRLEERRRRLEEELKRLNRQLEEDQAALRRELERLNARLPLASGARRIGIGFSPAIADVIASAKSLSGLALDGVKTAPSLDLWTGRPAGGATYAIPASRAKIAVAQIREHGRVAHAFLGVQTTDLTSADRERLKAPAEARVRIVNVSPDSPARDAGLRKDDVLLEIAGKNVESAADLVDLMARHRPGERITVQIWRDGERKSIDVTLRERPRQTLFVPPRFTVPRVEPFIVRPRVDGQQNTLRSFVRVSPEGRVAASAAGTGKSAKITLDAQDAVLEGVLRELSRATELRFTAEGDAARKRITLKVENVSVDDLVDSMSRLFHLRVERRDNTITFRSR